MAILSIANAQILHASGIPALPSHTKYRVELCDDATFALFKPGIFGEQKAFWVSLGMIALRTWTGTVQSGGGFVGGGFGILGAAEGIFAASVLNALTAKSKQYAMLAIVVLPLDGSQRELVLGFQNLTEDNLKTQIAEALPAWTNTHVKMILSIIAKQHITEQDGKAAYAQLEIAVKAGLLTRAQIEEMWKALAKVVPPPKLSPYSDSTGGSGRLDKLRLLADLRSSGALTQDEFEAEKARVLSSP